MFAPLLKSSPRQRCESMSARRSTRSTCSTDSIPAFDYPLAAPQITQVGGMRKNIKRKNANESCPFLKSETRTDYSWQICETSKNRSCSSIIHNASCNSIFSVSRKYAYSHPRIDLCRTATTTYRVFYFRERICHTHTSTISRNEFIVYCL